MRAINHALTGAFIGLVVQKPAIAVPLAIVSHYVCDVIPHHGANQLPAAKKEAGLRSKSFAYSLYLDALLCFVLVLVLAASRVEFWLLASLCAFLAAAPDFLSINRFLKARSHKKWKPGLHSKFAGRIQWFERPIGIVVEIAWAIGLIVLLAPFLS